VTITLKMHDFHVSKVSGANSVLDIYRIQPVHNWIGNRDGWFSSQIVYFIRYDISSQIFSAKILISNRIFSVEHRLFKSFIFGQKPSFQTKYFRRLRDFSYYQRFLFNDGFFCNIFYYFQYLVVISI
jgi:hypothetical protein